MLGIDIIEINRVYKAAQKNRFMERVFTPSEREYFAANGSRAQTLAGIFCAKEAAVKALGCGFGKVGFLDIEIKHDGQGKPYVSFHNHAIDIADGRSANISISHCKTYATAVCMLV